MLAIDLIIIIIIVIIIKSMMLAIQLTFLDMKMATSEHFSGPSYRCLGFVLQLENNCGVPLAAGQFGINVIYEYTS